MPRPKNDDLFASSTMSFGEHIEELRKCLFRALAGLGIGVLAGMLLANSIVKLIQSPLQEALVKYYVKQAEEDLQEQYDHDPPPEMLTMIVKDGLVPERVKIDPFGVIGQVVQQYPGPFGNLDIHPHAFSSADLEVAEVSDFAKRIVTDGKDPKSVGHTVWETLSPDGKTAVSRAAEQAEATEKDRDELLAALNQLVEQPKLHGAYDFHSNKTLEEIGGPFTSSLAKIATRLEGDFNADESRRLNRLLLSSVYRDYLRLPRLNVVDMTIWKPKEVRIQTLNAHEAFIIWMKAAVISGALLASPWIFWQIWIFVAAGLYSHEKQYVWVFLPFSMLLFLAGASLAFFFVFEPVLDFLFSFNDKMNIDPDPRISEWMGFVLFLPIGFGISFQLPLVMLFLQRIGIFTVSNYLERWRIAIVVIFVIAMLLTPADPMSMLLMAVPLTLLYFGGIALCKFMPQPRSPFELPAEV